MFQSPLPVEESCLHDLNGAHDLVSLSGGAGAKLVALDGLPAYCLFWICYMRIPGSSFWSCCSVTIGTGKPQNTDTDSLQASRHQHATAAITLHSGCGGKITDGLENTRASTKKIGGVVKVPMCMQDMGLSSATICRIPVPRKGSTEHLLCTESGGSTKCSTRSGHSASSFGSEFINGQIPPYKREMAKMQSQMKMFVKGMMKGREMSILSVDGQLQLCICSFDRRLRNYKIMISKETRSIPLSKFQEVYQGVEPAEIATPLDDLCATLVLDNGECLSFRFKDIAERETFAMCLQTIVDGCR